MCGLGVTAAPCDFSSSCMRVLFVCVFEFYLGGDHAKRVSMPPKHLACELERGKCTTRRVLRGAGESCRRL